MQNRATWQAALISSVKKTTRREHDIKVLNVAGSRGSKESGVAAFVKLALEEAFYPRAEAMVLRG